MLVSLASGTVNLVNPTVTKSGGPSNAGDNYNFYGINSGIMATGGGTVSIVGGTNGGGRAQASVRGDDTTVYIENVTINTSQSDSGGIMTTGGGVMVAKNLTVETSGQSSAPIRTDRGGGNVTVTGGSYTSNGLGSPAIYSTAEVVVNDATLTSNLSEGVCIEGQNSVALTNCTLTANNTQTNGNAQFLDAIILYQSQSGDAADGTSTFSMTGGSLVNKSGHLFHVTNTTAIINLEGVTIDDQGDGVLLSVCDDGWTGASNIATLNASGQTLTGDILVGSDSTLTLNLSDSSKFTGNISGSISNASGTSISTSLGTVSVTLDETSKWYLTGDTYVKSFDGTAANVITGSYKLYVNGSVLDGTTETEEESALKINNTTNATLITGTALADSILNSGDNVTISALGESDTIDNSGSNASILAGDGNDSISTAQEQSNVTIDAGSGDDFIYNYEMATAISINAGAGADSITNYGALVTILGGAGSDSIENNETADSVSIDGGEGNDFIINRSSNDATISGGAGDDTINLTNEEGTNLIEYTAGNDSIVGFGANVSLQIADGTATYSTLVSSDDLLVTVGDYVITLDGAASLESFNILGTDNSAPTWSLDKTIATYATSSDTLLTLTNIKTTDGLEVSNAGVVTVPLACLADSTTDVVLDGDNYSLALGQGMTTPTTTSASYADNVYTTAGKTKGYTLSGDEKSISYSAPTYKTLNFSGVADEATTSNFYLKGTTLTIGKAAVQTDGTALELLTDGYTLKLGKGMSAPETVKASYADNVYTTAGKTAGYTLADNTITYTDATTKEFTFTGVADEATTSNFYLKGTTLTIGKAAVQTDGTPLELLTDGYTLKLGKGMSAPTTVKASYADNVYTTAGKTAGYTLADNTITYSDATTKEFTFTGVADGATTSNFYLKGTTLTIGKAAVQTDGTPLELLTDGYTLKLGQGMSAPTTVTASYADNVYTTAGKSAGYTLADNTITYTDATTKEFTFTGVADEATTSNFYLKGTTLTIGKAAVQTDGTALELLTDGYTLKLGKGMTASETNDGTLSDGVYTYGGQTAGYILSGKSITYTDATSTQLELSGLANEPTAPTDGVMTLQATNFTDNVTIVDNAGEYSFAMAAGDYSGDTLTGSDAAEKILNAGTSLMISTGAGNDSIRNTGGSVTIDAGAGADTIAGSTKADVLDGGAGNDIIWGGKGNDSIFGGAGSDSLSGYAGNDTLWGGAGNDTLVGGAGVDTFIYTANTGTDRITDFTSSDLLQILDAKGAQGAFSDSALSGSNLTLTITGGGSVILRNVSETQTFNINGTTYSISDGKLK